MISIEDDFIEPIFEVEGYEDLEDDKNSNEIKEYDLTSTPNDFNILTLGSFIDSGSITIPGFQRNYVWDIKKASRLIESLILGLPVPQLFLYEQDRNKFSVIDGQQRLMTIYYFLKGRFPKPEKRPEIRRIFVENGEIPKEVFHDDEYFKKFKLVLLGDTKGEFSKFHGESYETLGDYKTQFDLRPIRNVIVKQNLPKDDDSSIYEIFNRLNSGGINLKPQEIRSSLYHSEFYIMLHRINSNKQWRTFLKKPNLDLHLRDYELLVRIFSFLIGKDSYSASLAKFLNKFSKDAKSFSNEKVLYYEKLFNKFMSLTAGLPDNIFINSKTVRFNVFLFETVFYATCVEYYNKGIFPNELVDVAKVNELNSNQEFKETTFVGTTSSANVSKRFDIALNIFDS